MFAMVGGRASGGMEIWLDVRSGRFDPLDDRWQRRVDDLVAELRSEVRSVRRAVEPTPGAKASSREIGFRSLDGLRLAGTFVEVGQGTSNAAVLVHGGGATRDEGGFFTRLADGLAAEGVPSLRFDLRAHGASEGAPEQLTLCGVVNDIRAAATEARRLTGCERVHVIGTSFAGGLTALFGAYHGDRVDSSRSHAQRIGGPTRLIEIDGAQHGFAVHDDSGYEDPQTQAWQAEVIGSVVEWVTANR